MLKIRNKNAQVSDTMTWLVATIIIVLILVVFIFISSNFATIKNLTTSTHEAQVGASDLLAVKTSLAFNQNPNNKGDIEKWIQDVP